MSELTIPNAFANGETADGNEVDANFDAIQTWADNHVVEKSGTTFTGAVLLSGAPTADLEPATKAYVDNITLKPAVFTRTTDMALSPFLSVDVTWESESNDSLGYWSSGTDITVPSNGIYLCSVGIARASGSGQVMAYITGDALSTNYPYYQNDTTIVSGAAVALGALSGTVRRWSSSAMLEMTAGQKLKVTLAEIGGTTSISVGEIKLIIVKLG
jgi:hypothetical protein